MTSRKPPITSTALELRHEAERLMDLVIEVPGYTAQVSKISVLTHRPNRLRIYYSGLPHNGPNGEPCVRTWHPQTNEVVLEDDYNCLFSYEVSEEELTLWYSLGGNPMEPFDDLTIDSMEKGKLIVTYLRMTGWDREAAATLYRMQM